MPTMRTEQIGFPAAIGTRPGRSRWRVALNFLTVLVFFGCGGVAVFDFLNGAYFRGSLNAIGAFGAGVQLGFPIAGRDFNRDFGNWLVNHPRLGLLFVGVLNVLIFGFIITWALHVKHENNLRRRAGHHVLTQAPVQPSTPTSAASRIK
jgi:hypothetical protein